MKRIWQSVNKGTAVKIQTESYPDEVFAREGQVTSATLLILKAEPFRCAWKFLIRAQRLKPGMFATAEIVTGISSRDAIMIPSSAIQKIEGKPVIRPGERRIFR